MCDGGYRPGSGRRPRYDGDGERGAGAGGDSRAQRWRRPGRDQIAVAEDQEFLDGAAPLGGNHDKDRTDQLSVVDFHNAFFVVAGPHRHVEFKRQIRAFCSVNPVHFNYCHRQSPSFTARQCPGGMPTRSRSVRFGFLYRPGCASLCRQHTLIDGRARVKPCHSHDEGP